MRVEPQTYFDLFEQASMEACSKSEQIVHTLQIGPHSARVIYAGSAMVEPVGRAMSHLKQIETTPPDLTVYVWDTASTDVQIPRPPWAASDYAARGIIRNFDGDPIYAAVRRQTMGISLYHRERALALHWTPDSNRVNIHERSFPLRTIINWWASQIGLQFAHAGGVGFPSGGVIIVGQSGAGKSTTVLSCMSDGFHYLSDDHVLLERSPDLYAHGLYHSAKLEESQFAFLPEMWPLVTNADEIHEDKGLMYIGEAFPDRISTGFPIKAILVPLITSLSDTRIIKTTATAALKALAPSSLFLIPDDAGLALRRMARIVQAAPCYELHVGTDMQQIPATIKSIL